jgi:hypothetical protein
MARGACGGGPSAVERPEGLPVAMSSPAVESLHAGPRSSTSAEHTIAQPPRAEPHHTAATQFLVDPLRHAGAAAAQQRSRLTRCAARLQPPGASSSCSRHVSPSPCPWWWLGTRLRRWTAGTPTPASAPTAISHAPLLKHVTAAFTATWSLHSRSDSGSSSNRLHFQLTLSLRYQGDVAERTLPLRRCSTAKPHWPSRF